jgi:tyrosyl-DNA phosphodiesterase 2
MKRIASILVEKRPTFVGMQELTNELAMELVPRLESAGYHVFRQASVRYGCAIAIDLDCVTIVTTGFLPFSTTIMERGLLFCQATLKQSKTLVLFTTTHLESFLQHGPSHDGARQRQGQLLQSKTFCDDFLDRQTSGHTQQSSVAILTGDFNWDDERKRSSGIDKPLLTEVIQDESWSDVWLQTRPGQEGYTYDAKVRHHSLSLCWFKAIAE